MEIGSAAKKVKKIAVLPDDVIVLENPETNTWLDEAVTKDVTPSDGSAGAYFQFRNTTGHSSPTRLGWARCTPQG